MSIQDRAAQDRMARAAGPQRLDPVEAMLRGRYRQGSFGRWVWKRIRDLYPK
ncbi:MAG: hypothetical protein R3322_10985 [Kiloniellales bacterium]|jgi:hypothetical protein|nr:hypothetical protein [Kiloniellales bacterium]